MTEMKYIAYFNELAEANRNSARNREFYLLNSWWTAATLRFKLSSKKFASLI